MRKESEKREREKRERKEEKRERKRKREKERNKREPDEIEYHFDKWLKMSNGSNYHMSILLPTIF